MQKFNAYRGVEISCSEANISASSFFSLLVIASSSVFMLYFSCGWNKIYLEGGAISNKM